MPLIVGQVLRERYRIDVLLGRGGMGAVYGAIDLTANVLLAIKENQLASPESQRQFSREARLLHELGHTNLPRVIDYFSIPGQGQYLAMEYIEGEDLDQILVRRGALPEAQALAWIGQVLDALEFLHERNVIHRDVKPANVKVTPQGRVYLVDFGLAKVYDPGQETTIGARGVTPGYAPPEQYGPGRTDARTDLYSAGATLYAMLTGQRPPDAVELMMDRAQLVPPQQINAALSASVEAAVLRAMDTRPGNRFQTATEFRAALKVSKPATAVPTAAPQPKPSPGPGARIPPRRGAATAPLDRLPLEPEMIRVPAILLLMGSSEGQVRAMQERFDWAADFGAGVTGSPFQWEQPQHGVALPAFEIARYPLTNAQYAAFVQATGQPAPAHWGGKRCPAELAEHPVVQVNWQEARAFASWLAERTGRAYRLPTEAEWERAARGDDLRLWPWGHAWDPSCANWDPSGQGSTSPVGQYSPSGDSPFGCADMAGNVWEWCSSQYRTYPYRADDGREKLRGRKHRVIRGGGWNAEHPGFLRCAARVAASPRDRFGAVGFRLAHTPGR